MWGEMKKSHHQDSPTAKNERKKGRVAQPTDPDKTARQGTPTPYPSRPHRRSIYAHPLGVRGLQKQGCVQEGAGREGKGARQGLPHQGQVGVAAPQSTVPWYIGGTIHPNPHVAGNHGCTVHQGPPAPWSCHQRGAQRCTSHGADHWRRGWCGAGAERGAGPPRVHRCGRDLQARGAHPWGVPPAVRRPARPRSGAGHAHARVHQRFHRVHVHGARGYVVGTWAPHWARADRVSLGCVAELGSRNFTGHLDIVGKSLPPPTSASVHDAVAST